VLRSDYFFSWEKSIDIYKRSMTLVIASW
jgi:hypothetical protein